MELDQNNLDVASQQASVDELNNCASLKPFAPRVTAAQLEINTVYPAPIIKRVKTRHGEAYVIENADFAMFLPKAYLNSPQYRYTRGDG